jgi:hypothetical protein
MWEPQTLKSLRASTACYRDNFTFFFTFYLLTFMDFGTITWENFRPILIKLSIGNPCSNRAQTCKNCHDISTFLNLLRYEFVAMNYKADSI